MPRPKNSYSLDNLLVSRFGECVLCYTESDEFIALSHYFGYFVKIGEKVGKKVVVKARLIHDDEDETKTFDSYESFCEWEETQEIEGNIKTPDGVFLVGFDFV